jgi:magnesium-protoporphyrin IX monomethyl ester (oxidative) cyclase
MAYFFEGDAPNSARDEDLVSLKAAVAAWRARWAPGAVAPQLTMVDAGPGRLIKDTRRCAVAPLYFVVGAELAVLETLRSPFARNKVAERLAAQFDPAQTVRALDRMVERGFVIDIDGVVLTLITEAGREVFDAAGRADMPHGYLLPRALGQTPQAPLNAFHLSPGPEAHASVEAARP